MLRFHGVTIDPVRRTIRTARGCVQFKAANNSKFLRINSCARFDLVCRLLLGPPATYEELWEDIYGHDAGGGPDYGTKGLMVALHQLKPKLEMLGLQLYKAQASRGRCYIKTWIAPCGS